MYQLRTAYITASSQYPEACYRWISFLAQRPDLYQAIPAQRSLLYSDTIKALFGDNAVNFFQEYEQILQSPHVVIFPTAGNDDGRLIEQRWLHRAMDRYVFEDADLEAELALAQQYVREYRECDTHLEGSPDINYSQYLQQLYQCRKDIDPTIG